MLLCPLTVDGLREEYAMPGCAVGVPVAMWDVHTVSHAVRFHTTCSRFCHGDGVTTQSHDTLVNREHHRLIQADCVGISCRRIGLLGTLSHAQYG